MKFVLATLGSRGDVEPYAAVGRELQRRGHGVCLGVPPSYLGFVESVGLAAVPHGENLVRKFGMMPNPISVMWEIVRDVTQFWPEVATALTSLADGADLLLVDPSQQGLAANVGEYYDIPLATLHFYPIEPGVADWDITKEAEDAHRRALGLPEKTGPSTPQWLEIQAYDELFFPGLAAEWSKHGLRRPFVGGLTLQLPVEADDEVASWIAAGTPPIYFGFGSVRVSSPAEVIAIIAAACAQLGERALICSGASDFTGIPTSDHVKIVGSVNHSAIFPACRAVVHHGGPGTTFAGIRAGKPTLILWVSVDQPMWAAAVAQLEIGAGRPFFQTTQKALVADLRSILTPHCAARTREVAAQMTAPAESAAAAADLLEDAARRGR
ncbi:glycosyltransferase [Mycobacterium sp. 663a-19]|uniref:glycosyltransferase n=1 Tax=Mycobacterium sp. 663a-19 TaxID=2986148 RepID=UPI002D1F2492|nr:glycosyltransferase [Mycobacterium sp. 663a-19]MEB3982833.1 glycosyltransferase [Mycobacterium sp. 663a-19]